MNDQFDNAIRDFLLPLSELKEGPSDTLYFLHNNGGLVFCEGYAHPKDGFYGSLIKYPDPKGHITLFGRPFNWTHRRYNVNGDLEIVPYREQIRRQEEILPELKKRPPVPPFAEYFCHYLFKDCRGFFGNKHSRSVWMKASPRIHEIIVSLEKLLGAGSENIGCTGSLAYGYYEEPLEDVDAVFFGTVKENRRTVERIRSLKKKEPQREVIELGKPWPLRFKHMGTLICPFFKYAVPDEIPLKDFRMTVVKEHVSGRGTVINDVHTAYLPAILTLDNVVLDKQKRAPIDLIIYDGALRGEFYVGDVLDVVARLVRIEDKKGTREALLITRSEGVHIPAD